MVDSQNSLVWSNYGYLCLAHNDHELANEAFNKAQVYDPENASAWLGQGLVAYRNDDFAEALSLFEQASTLSAGNLVSRGLKTCFKAEAYRQDYRSAPKWTWLCRTTLRAHCVEWYRD